jgi:hypothetical protein
MQIVHTVSHIITKRRYNSEDHAYEMRILPIDIDYHVRYEDPALIAVELLDYIYDRGYATIYVPVEEALMSEAYTYGLADELLDRIAYSVGIFLNTYLQSDTINEQGLSEPFDLDQLATFLSCLSTKYLGEAIAERKAGEERQ